MTIRYTKRESFWRGHWAAIDGSAQPTDNDDRAAYERGAQCGAEALAAAMRCRTYRDRWSWIGGYMSALESCFGEHLNDQAHELAVEASTIAEEYER